MQHIYCILLIRGNNSITQLVLYMPQVNLLYTDNVLEMSTVVNEWGIIQTQGEILVESF